MRLIRLACLLLGLFLAGNGLVMLAQPAAWYAAVPGVIETGPLNIHFVRDIGALYLAIGAGLGLAAVRPAAGGPYVAAGAAWLLAHAGVHVSETVVCGDPLPLLLRDLPGVYAPALLAAALAVALLKRRPERADLDAEPLARRLRA